MYEYESRMDGLSEFHIPDWLPTSLGADDT